MERAEYNRHSRAGVAETTKGGVETGNAGRAGADRPWEPLDPTRSSDVLTRIAWERVPTLPHVAKTRRSRSRSRRRTPDVQNARRSSQKAQSLRRTVQEPDFSILAQAAPVGTRSRASRHRLSDNDIRWSASDRRWFPARPAQHVHRRRNNNGRGRRQSALASARGRNGKRRRRDRQRRTRRSASTIGGAAPDTIIGRAAADRAGARPYRAATASLRFFRQEAIYNLLNPFAQCFGC